jgi:hypothetical protein
MCAAEFFHQRPNFSVDLAEIICQKLATLDAAAPLKQDKFDMHSFISPLGFVYQNPQNDHYIDSVKRSSAACFSISFKFGFNFAEIFVKIC